MNNQVITAILNGLCTAVKDTGFRKRWHLLSCRSPGKSFIMKI